jgi:hypothetical protein
MKLISIVETPADSKKKLVATFCQCPNGKTKCKPSERKTIQFGSKGSTTYASGASESQKDAYIARHSAGNEDWTKINAGSLSRYILWGSKSLKQGIKNFKEKFDTC